MARKHSNPWVEWFDPLCTLVPAAPVSWRPLNLHEIERAKQWREYTARQRREKHVRRGFELFLAGARVPPVALGVGVTRGCGVWAHVTCRAMAVPVPLAYIPCLSLS